MTSELVAELRRKLKYYGDETEYTDEELEQMIKDYTEILIGLTGVEVEETAHEDVLVSTFNILKTYNLNYYPVVKIVSVTVGDNELPTTDYILLSEDEGILFFKERPIIDSYLKIKYTTQTPAHILKELFYPLLIDYIVYRTVHGGENISSVTEGDVSVSYETGDKDQYNQILNRIDYLKSYTTTKARMIQ